MNRGSHGPSSPTGPSRDELLSTLHRLISLLVRNESPWSRPIAELRTDVAQADDPVAVQCALRRILAIYGGSGSFNDVVLHSSAGVNCDNAQFDSLRSKLHRLCREMVE
jgi:hypothetical protein